MLKPNDSILESNDAIYYKDFLADLGKTALAIRVVKLYDFFDFITKEINLTEEELREHIIKADKTGREDPLFDGMRNEGDF